MSANKARSYIGKLEDLKSKCEAIGDTLSELAEKMQEKYDNRSEKWQESEAGETMLKVIDCITSAYEYAQSGDLDSAIDALGDIEEE